MLDSALQTQLRSLLERLQSPIELVASLDDGDKSRELRELLTEIAALSDKVTASFDGTDERKPSFSVGRAGEPARIRFAGLPMGHEFTSLVLALLQGGGVPPKFDAAVIEQIRKLPGTYQFVTYVSLTCQNCPDVVQALNAIAAIHPRASHVMVDGALFQDEVNAKGILAVPSVYLDDEPFTQGRTSVEEILEKLDAGAAEAAAARLSDVAPFDVLVVGGGPAGSAAAVYAARKGIRTGVVAERFGGQVQDTMGIENFISVPHTEGPKLAAELEQHVRQYGVEVIKSQRAEKLEPAGADGLATVRLHSGAALRAKTVILSTGARWRMMNVPGEREHLGKGVCFCPHCDGPLFKGKRVAVIGGGNSGVEAAIDLAGVVGHVTLIEFLPELRADAVLQRKLASLPNVVIVKNAQTTEVTGDGSRLNGLKYKDRANGQEHTLELEGIFVQIGLMPNTEWLKDAVALSPRGEIEIDARGATSVPGVFAAGDATTVPYKQIVIAMGEGAKASLSAFDHLIRSSAPA